MLESALSRARPIWVPLLVALAPLIPFANGLQPARVFFTRDLGAFFWPYHLWAKHALASGRLPLWDEHVAFGQSAIADPLRMIVFPPALLLRLLFPAELGFNLLVALPASLAALGAYFLFRRVSRPAAAAAGAIIFGVSGPVVSSACLLNQAWVIAAIPWVVWGAARVADRATPGRLAAGGFCFAMLAAAGEPVLMLSAGLLAVAYAAASRGPGAGIRGAAAGALAAVGTGLTGALLAAVQLLPLADASDRSLRAAGIGTRLSEIWPIHPLGLVEVILPKVFGNASVDGSGLGPWLPALNDGLTPYYVTMYVGLGALALAAFGALYARSRWSVFWVVVSVVFLVLALGRYTPVHPALQSAIPFIRAFRFPSKFLVIAALGVAALAASGAEHLWAVETPERRRVTRGFVLALFVVALGAGAICAFVTVTPERAADILRPIALALDVRSDSAVEDLVRDLSAPVGRLAVIAFAWSALFTALADRRIVVAIVLLAAADPLVTNMTVTPTIESGLLGPPSWAQLASAVPGARVFVGKRPSQAVFGPPDVDSSPELPVELFPDHDRGQLEAMRDALFGISPSPWGVREAISHDLAILWPREYIAALRKFRVADVPARRRFLARSGVRYYLTTTEGAGASEPLMQMPADAGGYALRTVAPASERVFLAKTVAVVPDAGAQLDALFADDANPIAEPLVSEALPAVGTVGAGVEAPPRIAWDAPEAVDVEAAAPEGGAWLVLLDSYHPQFVAEVDGAPASIARANGLFRAVHLNPGAHRVRFVYRPWPLYLGALLTALTALGLVGAALWRRTRRGLLVDPPKQGVLK